MFTPDDSTNVSEKAAVYLKRYCLNKFNSED